MKLEILGVPTDFGANRRGVDMGPSAIRYANLIDQLEDLNLKVKDRGNINVLVRHNNQKKNEKKLSAIVEICNYLAEEVYQIVQNDSLPIILGGDHSITMGSLAGTAKVKQEVGLIWFDAHGDFNTHRTSGSGNIHGMPLASVVGRGREELVNCGGISPKVKEENTVLVGIRDLDEQEKKLLKESAISVFTMNDIDRLGMYQVMKEAIEITTSNTNGVHVSFDIDVLSPLEAPGVGTPVKGGITYREAHLALEMIAEAKILSSLDVVEVNPILDQHNKTAELAVDLITSIVGKKIL